MKKLVTLIDFTGVCELSLEHTAIIARESVSQLILLHIVNDPAEKHREKEIKEEVRKFAHYLEAEGVPFSIHIDYGPFFETIGHSLKALNADLLIVGTHGLKGIKQNFVGSNILKLIRLIEMPALVVQSHSTTPIEGYHQLLVPLLGKTENAELANPVAAFAKIFNAHVQFLTFFTPENEEEARKRTAALNESIAGQGVKTQVELEKSSLYSSSFSRSIVEFSDIIDAQLITLIINKEFENYFNETDQENILLNRLGKPVLCI